MFGGLIKSLDRLSSGIERMLDEPMIELESSTPLKCPHCGIINPTVVVPANDSMQGRVSEFVLLGSCLACGNEIFGISNAWMLYAQKEVAVENLTLLLERVYGNGRASHAGKN